MGGSDGNYYSFDIFKYIMKARSIFDSWLFALLLYIIISYSIFFYVIDNIAVFSEVIRFFVFCNCTIFNGFNRAVADAGHTVGTLIAPNRFFVCQFDVI